MTTRISDTILDGNMGEGWTDNYAAALAFAKHLEAAYRVEFGADADIHIDVHRNTTGVVVCEIIEPEDPYLEDRAYAVRDAAWESFCANPPAELAA